MCTHQKKHHTYKGHKNQYAHGDYKKPYSIPPSVKNRYDKCYKNKKEYNYVSHYLSLTISSGINNLLNNYIKVFT